MILLTGIKETSEEEADRVSVSELDSISLIVKLMVSVVLPLTIDWSVMVEITGASLTGLTVMETVPILLSKLPSLALKVKLSVPLKLASGA